MCRYKCQCCGPCFCCKDNLDTAFILGIAYIVLNALFFELLGLGITDGNPSLWIYFESCKIIHPIQHAVLIYGAHKRSTTTILIWIILTAVILAAHVISGKYCNQCFYSRPFEMTKCPNLSKYFGPLGCKTLPLLGHLQNLLPPLYFGGNVSLYFGLIRCK